ncbi:prolyl oligopeptidase family serine peptidase [Ideonella sp. DXS29W]|uniref:Prolyl oligopeptidase family serine peptidase n=1 Tax=Ideonella lacteola TaxID=2984193 RepID=A0ABU9C049_9BURK
MNGMSSLLQRIARLLLLSVMACGAPVLLHAQQASVPAAPSLSAARGAFVTKIAMPTADGRPATVAPESILRTLKYTSPAGELSAYLTPDPHDGKRHPAIIWITGGDCNSIGDVWRAASSSNDQTAAAYRRAGIVMMFPSLRGGNANPGKREAFYGETQDILAAADFLSTVPYVDPARIHLGGHSTGGTMALLTAEVTSRFRAVIAFGPVVSPDIYGEELLPVDFSKLDPRELQLRRPALWLDSIRSPTLVLEGVDRGNGEHLKLMKKLNRNPLVTFIAVPGTDHFCVLAPANALLARKIIDDTGPGTAISLSAKEIASLSGGSR